MSDISVEVLERALISRRRGLPLHLQVQSALRQAIEEHFEDGQSFWTEALLVERLGVSRATVRQALSELSRQGLLVRQAALGTTGFTSTATVPFATRATTTSRTRRASGGQRYSIPAPTSAWASALPSCRSHSTRTR